MSTTATKTAEVQLLYSETIDGVECHVVAVDGRVMTVRDNIVSYTCCSGGDEHTVYARHGKPTACTCPAKRYGPSKLCRHQKAVTAVLEKW